MLIFFNNDVVFFYFRSRCRCIVVRGVLCDYWGIVGFYVYMYVVSVGVSVCVKWY